MPIQVEGRSKGAGAGDTAHLVEDDPEDHGESEGQHGQKSGMKGWEWDLLLLLTK